MMITKKNVWLAAVITLCLGLAATQEATAQQDKSKRPSPPEQITGTVDGVSVTVDYSKPSVKGRQVWGELVPYNKVWRAGANEATWVEFGSDVKINGESLPKGKYSFFVIPKETGNWTLVFNKVWDQWGAYKYDEGQDALRVEVAPTASDFAEQVTYQITATGVSLRWEKKQVAFAITK